jgi:hypothetical protein
MYGNKFYSAAFYTGDLKCNYTLKTDAFHLFSFSLWTTFPNTSLVSTIFIMMHRIQYLRFDKYRISRPIRHALIFSFEILENIMMNVF